MLGTSAQIQRDCMEAKHNFLQISMLIGVKHMHSIIQLFQSHYPFVFCFSDEHYFLNIPHRKLFNFQVNFYPLTVNQAYEWKQLQPPSLLNEPLNIRIWIVLRTLKN